MGLIKMEMYSECLSRGTSVNVIIPEKGEGVLNSEGNYPVLWLLHGASEDYTAWLRNSSIERYLKRVGIACVMPSADLSFYTNVDGGRYMDYVALELPEICSRLFPISSDPRDNFITGLSMGGYGTMKLGFTFPEKYAAMGILSSANFIDLDVGMAPGGRRAPLNFVRELVFGTGEDMSAAHGTEHDMMHLAKLASESGKPLPKVFAACGTQDSCHDTAVSNIKYLRELENPYECMFMDGPGHHDFEFWDEWVQVFLQWLPIRQGENK